MEGTTVDQNGTPLWFVEPAEQLDNGAFARAIGTDDRGHLARLEGQAETLQCNAICTRVTECDILKLDPLLD
jgi:hypothetical protein